jgi:hypothetical protein
MQGKYILLVLLVLLFSVTPSAALTTKIVAGSPVFIGETNVDLTRALDNCRIIGWVPEGAERTMPAEKNITLRPLNEFSETLSKYTFSPADYRGYEGEWYCEERAPYKPVFVVHEPRLKHSAWDLDLDKDVTGTTVPATANITYRIDTNTDVALQHRYRLDLTPADGFYTVKLTDPNGRPVTNIYTGSYGAPNTVILTFETAPYITSSPYVWNFWKFGGIWDRQARNIQGDLVYPSGTYRFTAGQNLNKMQDTYKAAGITDTEGILTSSADITFVQPTLAIPVTTPPITAETTVPLPVLSTDVPATVPVTAEPVAEETTKAVYQPLPAWIALAALGFAVLLLGSRRT